MKKIALGLLICLAAGSPAWAEGLRVGRAAVKLTPPLGAPMGNSYGIQPAAGVRDDVYAKALVLEKDGTRTALVACDLISIRGPIMAEARRLIQQNSGIAPDHVILSATHCHAGPQMHPFFFNLLDPETRRLGEEYVKKLPSLIAESVEKAMANLTPARVRLGRTEETSVNFNRRFLMKDGTVRMNPGKNNPDAIRPVGPVDPDLSVIYFETLDSRPLSMLVNFALHVAVVGGNQVSSDYPGVLSRRISEVLGEDVLTIFTNGMSGNINQGNVHFPDQPRGHAEAARIGTILAGQVLKMLPDLRPVEVDAIRAGMRVVDLPVSHPSPQEVEQARAVFNRYGRPDAPPFHDVVKAWRIMDLAELNGRPLRNGVHAITLGSEIAIVGFPGDSFTELGMAVKTNSPFPFTIVSEQSGLGSMSYIPNRKAFPEGGYEVISARFLPGGGEMLADAAVQLLIDLFAPRLE